MNSSSLRHCGTRTPLLTIVSLSLLAVVTLISSRPAEAQTFGFEGQAGTQSPSGVYTTLSETSGGVTFTLMRENGGHFDIDDNTFYPSTVPAGWGNRSLDSFSDQTSTNAFIGNFSNAANDITGVSFEFGDYDADADTVVLQAYDGLSATGNLLGTTTITYPLPSTLPGDIGLASLTNLSGIKSIRFIGGSAGFPNSLYYDNFTITQATPPAAVPEPGIVMTGLSMAGMTGLGLIRGRRRARISKTTA